MMWHHLFPLCDRNMYNSTFSCAHNCICANQPSQSLTVFNEEHLMLLSFKEVLRFLRMKICLSSTFDLHFSFYQLSSVFSRFSFLNNNFKFSQVHCTPRCKFEEPTDSPAMTGKHFSKYLYKTMLLSCILLLGTAIVTWQLFFHKTQWSSLESLKRPRTSFTTLYCWSSTCLSGVLISAGWQS